MRFKRHASVHTGSVLIKYLAGVPAGTHERTMKRHHAQSVFPVEGLNGGLRSQSFGMNGEQGPTQVRIRRAAHQVHLNSSGHVSDNATQIALTHLVRMRVGPDEASDVFKHLYSVVKRALPVAYQFSMPRQFSLAGFFPLRRGDLSRVIQRFPAPTSRALINPEREGCRGEYRNDRSDRLYPSRPVDPFAYQFNRNPHAGHVAMAGEA